MFAIDRRLLAKLEPVVGRVLIVDPNPHAARLLYERALSKATAAMEPGIIFIERTGPGLDGESLARRLRRSDMDCRRAPIIMVTAEATATTILGARDAGVHEFLRKPFTSGDLLKRVENVALRPAVTGRSL